MSKNAAIIVRVSTQSQFFERQISDLKALAKAQGYMVKEKHIYAEKISGLADRSERGELTRLIEDIESGTKIDMVFATEVSRIFREPDLATNFIKQLQALGVPVYIQNMRMASLNEKGERQSMFWLILGILSEFSRSELEYISSRMRSGKRAGYAAGRFSGSRIPFGFMLDKKDIENKGAKLIVNPDESSVIKKMYQLCIDGSGQGGIAAYLNTTEHKPRGGSKFWHPAVVRMILKNTIYYGTRSYTNYEKVNGKRVKAETQTYENIVPAIVTKDTWMKANNLSKLRSTHKEGNNVRYLYLLKDSLFCSECGAPYVAFFNPGKRTTYSCSNKLYFNKHKGITCNNAGISIEKIESLAWHIVKNSEEFWNHLEFDNTNVKQLNSDIIKLELELKRHNQDIAEKKKELERWYRLFATGKIAEPKLMVEDAKVNKAISNFEGKATGVQDKINVKADWIQKHNNLVSIKSRIDDIGTDRTKIAEILPEVLSRIFITSVSDKKVHSNLFIITALLYGDEGERVTCLFNKATMEMITQPWASLKAVHTDMGLRKFDVQKIALEFQQLYKLNKGSKEIRQPGKSIVPLIPFTYLNTLDDNKPVKVDRTRKQYRTGRKKGKTT